MSAYNLNCVIGEPLSFSGVVSKNEIESESESTNTGAFGFEGLVAAVMKLTSLRGPQPLKFFARYLTLYDAPLIMFLFTTRFSVN